MAHARDYLDFMLVSNVAQYKCLQRKVNYTLVRNTLLTLTFILVYLIVLTGQISGLKCKRVIVVLPVYKFFTVLRKDNMIA